VGTSVAAVQRPEEAFLFPISRILHVVLRTLRVSIHQSECILASQPGLSPALIPGGKSA